MNTCYSSLTARYDAMGACNITGCQYANNHNRQPLVTQLPSQPDLARIPQQKVCELQATIKLGPKHWATQKTKLLRVCPKATPPGQECEPDAVCITLHYASSTRLRCGAASVAGRLQQQPSRIKTCSTPRKPHHCRCDVPHPIATSAGCCLPFYANATKGPRRCRYVVPPPHCKSAVHHCAALSLQVCLRLSMPLSLQVGRALIPSRVTACSTLLQVRVTAGLLCVSP